MYIEYYLEGYFGYLPFKFLIGKFAILWQKSVSEK